MRRRAHNYLLFLAFLAVICSCSNEPATSVKETGTALAENLTIDETSFTEFASTRSGNQREPVRYKVKDGKITYLYRGLQTGSEVVYFTNYGMVEIKFTQTVRDNPFQGEKEVINLTTLMRDSAIYVVDNLTKNARKLDNTMLYEAAEESPTRDLNEVAESMYLSKGGKMEGLDTLLGLPTERWVIKATNTKEWRWNGIMVKTLIDLSRNYVQVEAIEIDTLSPLPAGIFDLPTDVNVQDGISMKQWMEDLSKPIQRKQFFDFTDPNKAYDKQGNVIPLESLRVE